MITIKQGIELFASIKAKKIYRNFESESKITVVNNSAEETLPKTLLFTDSFGCASFKVYLKGGLVPSGESQMTLVYDGIYKRDVCTEKEISLNGSNAVLKINCATSGGGGGEEGGGESGGGAVAPLIQGKNVSLINRADIDFNNIGFDTLYYSPIASPITELRFWGDISTITYNGLPYVANTFIPYADIVSGLVVHHAPDVDSAVSYGVYYSVKDLAGNQSEPAIINISNNTFATINWSDKFVLVRESDSGSFTKFFTINYSGATGQVVTADEIVYVNSDVNYFTVSINETKTLSGSGSLEFKLDIELLENYLHNVSFIIFGTVILSIRTTIVIPPVPQVIIEQQKNTTP